MNKKYSIQAEAGLETGDFKKGVNDIKSNIGNLIKGVEGTTGSLGEMRKALMNLKNISFAGKSVEEINAINLRIGQLTDEMGDLRSMQKAMGTEFGSVMAGGLQTLSAVGEVVVGVATAFGVSKEKAEKYQQVMVTLIGVTQALGVIEDAIATRQFQNIALRIKETASTVAKTAATKAATIAQWALNSAMKASVFGAILVAVTALAVGLYNLAKSIGANIEETKRHIALIKLYNDERIRSKKVDDDYSLSVYQATIKQEKTLDRLIKLITKENTSSIEKRKALQELIDINPEYLKGLTLNNITTYEGIGYINKYREALKQKAKAMAAESVLTEQYTNQFKKQQEIRNAEIGLEVYNIQLRTLAKQKEAADELGMGGATQVLMNDKLKQIENQKNKIIDLNKELKNTNKIITDYSKIIDNNQSLNFDFNTSNNTSNNNNNQSYKSNIVDKPETFLDIRINEDDDTIQKQLDEYVNNIEVEPIKIDLAPIPVDSFQGIISEVGNLSGAMTGFFEQDSKAYKAFATTQALISTYLAAAQIMANTAKLGPIAMGISFAATIATGLATVAKIQGFAEGGIVGGNSFTGDKVPAMVNSGEMILNRTQQSNLLSMINGGGGGYPQTIRLVASGSDLVGTLDYYNRRTNKIR